MSPQLTNDPQNRNKSNSPGSAPATSEWRETSAGDQVRIDLVTSSRRWLELPGSLSTMELKRRLWHMLPGLLPIASYIYPHKDPLSPTFQKIAAGLIVGIAALLLCATKRFVGRASKRSCRPCSGTRSRSWRRCCCFPNMPSWACWCCAFWRLVTAWQRRLDCCCAGRGCRGILRRAGRGRSPSWGLVGIWRRSRIGPNLSRERVGQRADVWLRGGGCCGGCGIATFSRERQRASWDRFGRDRGGHARDGRGFVNATGF